MCQAMLENGGFDPALCPLLKDLSPDEIAVRMRQQPIQSCVARMEMFKAANTADYVCPALEPT